MLPLAIRNLIRRPVRSLLAAASLAIATALLASILAFTEGYQGGLRRELDRMGIQLMLVPLGCPYDAAARAVQGRPLEDSFSATVLDTVRSDPRVGVAAPLLLAASNDPVARRTDLWVGVDDAMRALKPWWQLAPGSHWFEADDSVLLGAEAAETELRDVGDLLYSPATRHRYRVCGVLDRTGTGDDHLFFVPLASAQRAFRQEGRLSAVAVRLKDPADLMAVMARFQRLPGVQVVTLTEMTGAFLNLVGAARLLAAALVLVALAVSALAIFNTGVASVLERRRELALLRAVGASVWQLFGLVLLEAVVLAAGGVALGLTLAAVGGPAVEVVLRRQLPLAPEGRLLFLTWPVIERCLVSGITTAIIAVLGPAWWASRLLPASATGGE